MSGAANIPPIIGLQNCSQNMQTPETAMNKMIIKIFTDSNEETIKSPQKQQQLAWAFLPAAVAAPRSDEDEMMNLSCPQNYNSSLMMILSK